MLARIAEPSAFLAAWWFLVLPSPGECQTPNPLAFVVNDIVVSDPFDSIIDPEWDKNLPTLRMSFQVKPGDLWVRELWVADVDPVTGTWTPTSGRQTLVDTDLVEARLTRQGPEWAYDDIDNRILYTKYINPTQYELWQAWLDPVTGYYVTVPLASSEGKAVVQGSKTPEDPFPRVLYSTLDPATGKPLFGWREIDDSLTDTLLPAGFKNSKWIKGERALVGTIKTAGVKQVFHHEIDTGVTTQLTFDAKDKRFPLLWFDAAFGGRVMTAVINDRRIGVWAEIRGQWDFAASLKAPSPLPFVFKPDLFIWQGTSYLAYHTHTKKSGKKQNTMGIGEVWVTRISGNGSFRHRQVSDPAIERIKDVENLITTSTVYVYYDEILPDGRRLIHRADTGLSME